MVFVQFFANKVWLNIEIVEKKMLNILLLIKSRSFAWIKGARMIHLSIPHRVLNSICAFCKMCYDNTRCLHRFCVNISCGPVERRCRSYYSIENFWFVGKLNQFVLYLNHHPYGSYRPNQKFHMGWYLFSNLL